MKKPAIKRKLKLDRTRLAVLVTPQLEQVQGGIHGVDTCGAVLSRLCPDDNPFG